MPKRKRPKEEFFDDLRPMKKQFTVKQAVFRVFEEYINKELSFEQILDEVMNLCEMKKILNQFHNKDDLRPVLQKRLNELKEDGSLIAWGNTLCLTKKLEEIDLFDQEEQDVAFSESSESSEEEEEDIEFTDLIEEILRSSEGKGFKCGELHASLSRLISSGEYKFDKGIIPHKYGFGGKLNSLFCGGKFSSNVQQSRGLGNRKPFIYTYIGKKKKPKENNEPIQQDKKSGGNNLVIPITLQEAVLKVMDIKIVSMSEREIYSDIIRRKRTEFELSSPLPSFSVFSREIISMYFDGVIQRKEDGIGNFKYFLWKYETTPELEGKNMRIQKEKKKRRNNLKILRPPPRPLLPPLLKTNTTDEKKISFSGKIELPFPKKHDLPLLKQNYRDSVLPSYHVIDTLSTDNFDEVRTEIVEVYDFSKRYFTCNVLKTIKCKKGKKKPFRSDLNDLKRFRNIRMKEILCIRKIFRLVDGKVVDLEGKNIQSSSSDFQTAFKVFYDTFGTNGLCIRQKQNQQQEKRKIIFIKNFIRQVCKNIGLLLEKGLMVFMDLEDIYYKRLFNTDKVQVKFCLWNDNFKFVELGSRGTNEDCLNHYLSFFKSLLSLVNLEMSSRTKNHSSVDSLLGDILCKLYF